MATGDADAPAGAQHARPGDEPGADSIPHTQLRVVAAAEVADGGDTGLERPARPQNRLDDGGRVGLVQHHRGGIGLGPEAEMHVAVDEPG
jgi:hypothetical protein